ncbi:hypothetical protein D6851_02520 [Altericroceibacterium spongiae]|uniref:Uncharacterized protein n=1 Tax=Altericroceibacterium spongiae TaxID=2320269 RepID=A0A420ERN4_9SPHN|nr:hypothetical protein [Altericroceibacterium spongiae]RKF23364.1 hypothetical protein D6851_02520 [Altericroceibacterium spongiae]
MPRYDKGTERAQAMQALYGQDGCDAIGRAYRAGLLGAGSEAKALLDTARAISNAYWAAYSTGSYKSPLAGSSSGSVIAIDHAKVLKREEWLNESLCMVHTLGPQIRRAFYQLVIDVHPDCGPDWLDRLLFADRRAGIRADEDDVRMIRYALEGLAEIAA